MEHCWLLNSKTHAPKIAAFVWEVSSRQFSIFTDWTPVTVKTGPMNKLFTSSTIHPLISIRVGVLLHFKVTDPANVQTLCGSDPSPDSLTGDHRVERGNSDLRLGLWQCLLLRRFLQLIFWALRPSPFFRGSCLFLRLSRLYCQRRFSWPFLFVEDWWASSHFGLSSPWLYTRTRCEVERAEAVVCSIVYNYHLMLLILSDDVIYYRRIYYRRIYYIDEICWTTFCQ